MARRIIKRDEEQESRSSAGAQSGEQSSGRNRLPRANTQKKQVIRLDTATPEVIERACSRAASQHDADALRSEYRYYHSDGYNEREHKLLQSLGDTGITRTAGSRKPLYDMDMDSLWDAMRAIPDKERRNQAYDTLSTLTKTKGSRFYGYKLPKTESERAYIGTADMPGDAYDKWKKSLDSRFYTGSGHEQENAAVYEQLYNAAVTGAANETQRYWYLAALDDAYEAQTRKTATDPQTMSRRVYQTEQTGGTDSGEAEKAQAARKPGLMERAADAAGSLLQKAGGMLESTFRPDGEEQEVDPRIEALNAQIREADQNADPRRADALAQERAQLIAQMAQQEPEQAKAEQPQAKDVPRLGGMLDAGFAAEQEAKQTAEDAAKQMPKGALNLTHDPIRAIRTAKTAPETLDEQTRELVNELATTSTMGKLAYYGTPFLPVEEQLNAQADAGTAERTGYLQGDVSGVIGGTLGGYYARIQHRSFPEALRDDAMAVLYETGMEAEQAVKSGAFTYDPEKENLYEAYLSQHPHRLDNLKGVFATLGEMRAQQREQARQAGEQAQLLEDERDELAREHLRSGQYTQADYDRVYDKAPVVNRSDAMQDETYAQIAQDIALTVSDSYVQEGGFFNEQTERYLLESGLAAGMDSVAAMQYKDVLGGYAADEAMRDLRVARALGYGSLADYYEKTGGGSMDDLCARAALRMEQFGSSVSEETMAQAEQTAQYEGTGDAGVLDVVGLSAQMGTAQTAGEILEAFWTAQQTTAAGMQGIVASNRYEYAKRYSPVMASYAARRDWERAIEGGQLPNEEWAQYARAYLDAGGDPFQLGPVQNTEGRLAQGAADADKWADSVLETAQKTLTSGQGKAFEIGSGAVFNTEMQAMSTAIALLTGSGALGMGLSFGLASYAGETREQLAYGPQKRTLAEVNAMGLAHAASDTIANTATSEKLTGKLTSAFGINAAIANGAASGGSTAASKGMAAMLGAFGKGFARGATDMAVDEVVKDEFKERWLWNVIGTAGNAALDGATIVEAAGKALEAASPADTAAGVIADAPDNLVAMLPMIFMGGMGDGVTGALQHFPRTRRAAQRVSETGNAQDAKAFVREMNAEIASPEAKEELSDALRAAAVGQKAAVELVTDPALREQAQKAQRTQEQADAHRATIDAESARREAAAQAMRAAEESGDVDAELAAADEAVKAAHNIAEAQREAEQKALEAGTQATEAVSAAIHRGEAAYERERRATAQLLAEIAADADEQAISAQEAMMQRRIDWLNEQAVQAIEAGDDARGEELLTQSGVLAAYLDDMQEARLAGDDGREDALEQARARYEAMISEREDRISDMTRAEMDALQAARQARRSLEGEKRDLNQAFSALRAQKLYVDEAQKREILYLTGAGSLSQANRMLGTRLTAKPGNGAVPVDSSWYQDFKVSAPGYFSEEWDAHPEYAVVSLGQRMRALDGRIADAKEKEGKANEAWQRKLWAADETVREEARQTPPGEALSQFENRTYPESDMAVEQTAQLLAGTTHKVHAVADMKAQAEDRIARTGLRGTVRELLHTEHMTDADIYAAQKCLETLKANGDTALHTMLAMKLGTGLTKTGQELRAAKEARAKTAAGAVTNTMQMADAYNQRKGQYRKQIDEQAVMDALDDQALSLGEAGGETFLEGTVSDATSDPVMQKLASDVRARSGGALTLYWADLGERTRGFYDRSRGAIVINQRVGASQAMMLVAMHEYTHYMEGTKGYDAYADALLKAAYGKDYESASAYKLDSGAVRDTYAEAGQALEDADVRRELVAQAAEKVITGEAALQDTLFAGRAGAAVKVLSGLDHFLNAQRAREGGKEEAERFRLLEAARRSIRRTITQSGRADVGGTQDGAQYAISRDAKGKPFVVADEDILDGLPESEWIPKVKETLATRFPDGITVGNSVIRINKKTRKEWTSSRDSKWLKANSPEAYADKLRAAGNADEILRVSDGYINEKPNHERKDGTVDFSRGSVRLSIGGKDYSAEVIVGSNPDGSLFLYDMVRMNRTEIERRPSIPVTAEASPEGNEGLLQEMQRTGERKSAPRSSHTASLYDSSIAQDAEAVNTKDMPDSVQYALQTETDTGAASGRLTGNRQQRITEAETADGITAAMPEGDIAMTAQPDGEQTRLNTELPAAETVRRATEGIDALRAREDVSTDNRWGLPLPKWKQDMIRQYHLEKVELPGIHYNRATRKQRMLAAILTAQANERGPGRQTLSQQLRDMKRGLAVVTDADLNYILSQAAIVEACDRLDEDGVPIDREGKLAYARMLEAQSNVTPTSMLTKLQSLQYLNMLSAPATAVRNVAGNKMMHSADQLGMQLFGGWIDAAVAKRTGTRTVSAANAQERRAGKQAQKEGFRDAFDDAFVAKADTGPERKYVVEKNTGRVFESDFMENARTIVGFAMEADDRANIARAQAEEEAAIRRIGMQVRGEDGKLRAMTDAEIAEEARSRAMERFFHNQNFLSRMLSGDAGKGGNLLKRIIIPFVKTPSNVALRMLDFSPLGLAKAAVYDGMIMGGMNHGAQFDQRKFVMGMTRGLTGTAVTALGMVLANAGVLGFGRGEDEDKKRRDVRGATGEPYGMYIRIGDTMHEIAFSMPVMAGLEIGARLYEGLANEDDAMKIAGKVFNSSMNQLFENSYLKTVKDIFTSYGNENLGERVMKTAMESFMTQTFSPSWLRAIAKTMDPYVRDTTDSSPLRALINKTVIQNWPALRQMLPVRTDVTGEAMRQGKAYQQGSRWESGVMAFVDAMLSPTATYEERDDAALSELLRLSYDLDETAFLPEAELIAGKNNMAKFTKTMAKALGEDAAFDVELTDDERRMANELYGRILFGGTGRAMYRDAGGGVYHIEGLRSLMDSPAYAAMDDEERMSAVKTMKAEAKNLVMTYLYDTLEGM